MAALQILAAGPLHRVTGEQGQRRGSKVCVSGDRLPGRKRIASGAYFGNLRA
jgi:hypothetical protein